MNNKKTSIPQLIVITLILTAGVVWKYVELQNNPIEEISAWWWLGAGYLVFHTIFAWAVVLSTWKAGGQEEEGE